MATRTHVDAFTRGYIHAAAWTQDPNPGSGEYPEPVIDDEIDPAFVVHAIRDCAQFQTAHSALLDAAGTDAQNGHDLWLTRNGHGVGFWDRGYPEPVGAALTDAAQAMGEVYEQVFADARDIEGDAE